MNFSNLENKIDYVFKNKKLLKQALTHASVNTNEDSYERLEFLGDRILNFLVADEIFRIMPLNKEGEMHLVCENLINEKNLYEISKELGLSNYLKTQKGKNNFEIKNNQSILSDVLEALIAAIYLDGGLVESKKFVINNFNFLSSVPIQNPKSVLQQKVLSFASDLPLYTLIKKEGPDHNPDFIVQVETFDKLKAVGRGKSIKEAEKNAASNLLLFFD